MPEAETPDKETGEDGDHDSDTQAATPRTRRGSRTRKFVLIAVIGLLVLTGGVAGGLYLVSERLAGNVQRVPSVFDELDPAERPQESGAPDADARTFVLVGTDSRSEDPTTGSEAGTESDVDGGARSDVIMLVRLAADGQSASVVSIPRDTWVDIPGRGTGKVNAAYAHGGASLLVHTLETLTDVRIDHFAVVDFAGFEAMTDAVGGIDVTVAEATSNDGVDFDAGVNHLDGEQALAYVRQRHGLPDGDLDRVRRHQNVLRAVLREAMSGDTLSSPGRAYGVLDTLTDWVSVDDTLTNDDMRSLVFTLRSLRSSDVTFLTAPVTGTGMEGDQSVVYLDEPRGEQLWSALEGDDIGSYARDNQGDLLGEDIP